MRRDVGHEYEPAMPLTGLPAHVVDLAGDLVQLPILRIPACDAQLPYRIGARVGAQRDGQIDGLRIVHDAHSFGQLDRSDVGPTPGPATERSGQLSDGQELAGRDLRLFGGGRRVALEGERFFQGRRERHGKVIVPGCTSGFEQRELARDRVGVIFVANRGHDHLAGESDDAFAHANCHRRRARMLARRLFCLLPLAGDRVAQVADMGQAGPIPGVALVAQLLFEVLDLTLALAEGRGLPLEFQLTAFGPGRDVVVFAPRAARRAANSRCRRASSARCCARYSADSRC